MPASQAALLSPRQIRALLAGAGLAAAKKGLAQHFLIDGRALRAIVECGDVGPEDVVVEVGPGLGVLTHELVSRARLVVAVELDQKLCAFLRERFGAAPNLALVNQDVMDFDPGEHLPGRDYKVIANLPYYLASAAVRHFLEADPRPRLMVVTVQKEVAMNMAAGPSTMGLLSVAVQLYGRAKIVARIPPQGFYPAPKVHSAVVRIEVYDEPLLPVASIPGFFSVVRAGFSAPRKQLKNALTGRLRLAPAAVSGALERAGIEGTRRAETLDLQEWRLLYQAFEDVAPEVL